MHVAASAAMQHRALPTFPLLFPPFMLGHGCRVDMRFHAAGK
jgi:hypothetical protein